MPSTQSQRLPRRSFAAFLVHLHPRTVPEASTRFTYTWCLGGLALWTFLIECVTGVLLLFHYQPTSANAYASIQTITHVVPYGFFVRNVHYWAGQLMVVLVVLHLIRVFVAGAYSDVRKFNWVIGMLLLALTLFVDFTGYLLVWDDRSLWAWTIARNLASLTPIAGSGLASLLFGPESVSDAVLVRLYAWHVILVPLLMIVLMALHFWRVRKDGISRPL